MRDEITISNPCRDVWFDQFLRAHCSRRDLLKGSLSLALACLFPASSRLNAHPALLGFSPVPVSVEDTVRVPEGYTASVLYRWGDPVGSALGSPSFREEAGNSAEEQALQAGMHHDGLHYFSLPYGSKNSRHGLLVVNHEYTDDGLLHADGMSTWNAEKVRKAQAAHGISVVEVREVEGRWEIIRPSHYAWRITAYTPLALSGPAAGHELLRTSADTQGNQVLGTLNNCASGYTPWGTYLTCEKNFNGYFLAGPTVSPEMGRYGIGKGFGFRWNEFDSRFNCTREPNEPNRFGYVVEIDPYDPSSKPIKRTALGRFKHEGAALSIAPDGRVVYYMGDDEAFEYIYKFVSARPWNSRSRSANGDLLDDGTLYVAKFLENGKGVWIPLVLGRKPLIAANGFSSQAEVLVKTRLAADASGATPMDRREWIAVHPQTRDVYISLTNNARRGDAGSPQPDAANPRMANSFGHIVRWCEVGGDPTASIFDWDVFLLAGDPAHKEELKRGTIKGDGFGSPDGLWFDPRGVLWIQTDVSTRTLRQGDYANLGNNQMLAVDPLSGEVRRFLTGPNGSEITGIAMTPDGKTLFVNIQHPGETAAERSKPENPTAVSRWPDGGRPRSATVVIRKDDSGLIGT
jgi:secreted PhoX family phosphatase